MPKCFFCGADTPIQYRRPGLLSALPPGKRGRFGACPDHESDARAKLAAAIGLDPSHAAGRHDPRPEQGGEDAGHAGRASAGKRPAKADKPDTGQGSLF